MCRLPLPASLTRCIAWKLSEPARGLTLAPYQGLYVKGGVQLKTPINDLLIRSSKCIASYRWPLFRVGLMDKSWSITFLVYQDDNH